MTPNIAFSSLCQQQQQQQQCNGQFLFLIELTFHDERHGDVIYCNWQFNQTFPHLD